MFLFFLFFSIILFFALFFNLFLFAVIYVHSDKTKIPSVYIYNMILGNSVDILTLFFNFLLPFCMDDDVYFEFRRIFGPYLTLLCSFSYEHPLYLTVLMVVHRISAIKDPMNKNFTNRKLWVYCAIISILSLISLLIPFFSECPVNIDFHSFSFAAACVERHPVTNLQNKYLIVIPFVSMMLNILLIFHLGTKRGAGFRNNNRISTISISTSSVRSTRLPPLRTPRAKQNFERTLLFQSISTTAFLLGYELTGLFIRVFSEEYSQLPQETRRFVFYSRISASSLLCFLVYFVGTPVIRKLIIGKIVFLYRHQQQGENSIVSGNRV